MLLISSLVMSEEIKVIEIDGSTTPAMGIIHFQIEGTIDIEKPSEVISQDLALPGYFKTVISPEFDSTLFQESKAYYYIEAKIISQGPDIRFEGYVMDVATRQQILGKSYSVPAKDLRRVLHTFSDEVLKNVLGEQGVSTSRLLAVTKSKGHKNIKVMDYDGHRSWMLTNDKHINTLADWGHDNTQIFFTSFRPGYPSIYRADLSNGRRKHITPGVQSFGPKVHPKGAKLLYTKQQSHGSDVYRLDLLTNKSTQITYGRATETSPEWSPNGYEVLYTSDKGGNPKIYKVDFDGLNEKRITWGRQYIESSAWSPKGDKIAYVGMDKGRLNVYVMNIDATGVQQLTSDNGNNESPTWSPDGKMIAFSSNRKTGTPQIYIMRADGSGVTQMTHGAPHTAPRWSK